MADKYVMAKRVGLFAGVLLLVISIVLWYFCWFYPQTTVIVLRHAERAGTAQDDRLDPLTTDGQTRAQELARVLESADVSVIYVTQAVRTQQTAQPLVSRGIPSTEYVYGTETDIDNLVREVRSWRNRGRVIVIVGHSDTVPTIVDKLGGGTVTVGPSQFDNLFVLTLRRWSSTRLIKATYGAPRTCAECVR